MKIVKNTSPILVFLILLIFSGCSHSVKITKKMKNNADNYYTVATDMFYLKPPSNEIPFEIYAQYTYEKDKLGDKFVFALKFINYGYIPRIQSVKLSIDGYEQNCTIDRRPVIQAEGVKGVSETVFFRVPRPLVEEIIATRKAYIDMEGYHRFNFFIPRDAIDVLGNFYDKVEETNN
jgi:hypothetical protein